MTTHTPADIHRIRIAIARDPAFCFYYSENLTLLEDAGAELCPFSPTSESSLPAGIGGIYIGGGYPESFLNALASNFALKDQIRALAAQRIPIYAECGGFMYLGRTLAGADRSAAPMVGIFPLDTLMDPEYLAIRYVTVRTIVDSPLGPAGTTARGQEFHQSRIISLPSGTPVYHVTATSGEQYQEGQLCNGSVGSDIHLHFASNPDLPNNFVENCSAWSGFCGASATTAPGTGQTISPLPGVMWLTVLLFQFRLHSYSSGSSLRLRLRGGRCPGPKPTFLSIMPSLSRTG